MRRTTVVSAVLLIWFGSGVFDTASGQIERPGTYFASSYWAPSDPTANQQLRPEISNGQQNWLNQDLYGQGQDVSVDRFQTLGSQQNSKRAVSAESLWAIPVIDDTKADAVNATKPRPDPDVWYSSAENNSYHSGSGEEYSPVPTHERLIPPSEPEKAIEPKTPLSTSIDSWLSLFLRERTELEPNGYSIASQSLLPEDVRINQKRLEMPRGTGIFNYQGGYINPYYPYPMDTPTIRVGAEDYHEGWVSKYLYTKPTVSPYLNLLRHDVRLYSSTRYHTFVRPLLDKRAEQMSPPKSERVRQIHFDTRTMQGDIRRISPGVQTTGHPTHFMGQFATTWR